MKYTIDTHTYTLVSGHAYNTIDEMAAYAAGIGVTHLAITDHAPKMPGSAGILYFSNMKIIPREKCGVRIWVVKLILWTMMEILILKNMDLRAVML